MGFKIKNSLTGEFEKLPILTLKGEKGETGGVEEYNKVDYMGNKYETLKQANDANVEYAVKTAIGEFNYLDYDGQHITATDTIEGRSKSAILSGQTLVNLVPKQIIEYTASSDWDGFNVLVQNSKQSDNQWRTLQDLKPNTKYYISCYVETFEDVNGRHYHLNNSNQNCIFADFMKVNGVGHYQWISRTKSELTDETFIALRCQNAYARGKIKIRDIMIIEYQEGMENWDIPYFEGMTSVKAPVLTTIGKNLLNYHVCGTRLGATVKNITDNSITFTAPQAWAGLSWVCFLEPNQEYTVSFKTDLTITQLKGYVRFPNTNENATGGSHKFSFRTDSTGKIQFTIESTTASEADITVSDVQIEKGSAATSYEPYKTNILTVNEDVTLRGIGDVTDELDLLTGELTQRIGEVILDGSEKWYGSVGNFRVNIPNVKGYKELKWGQKSAICNLYPAFEGVETDYYIISEWEGNQIRIHDIDTTLEELKSKLAKNPLHVIFISNEDSVKTVDLSDNHVYSYKGTTHYDCSSAEGSLVPTLSVKVPTDVQATIAQQRETIQTLNSENERLNQIQEALKASMLDSQVQLMNLSWNTDFEVFTLRESIAPKDFLLASRTGSNIDKFSQAKFIIENDCPDLEKLNSQIEYYFSKDVFSQEQFEELTDLISIVKGENGCEY